MVGPWAVVVEAIGTRVVKEKKLARLLVTLRVSGVGK